MKVLPIFFVPKDQADPTADQSDRFMRHLEWTRKRYAELLPGHITFKIAGKKPIAYRAPEDLAFYRAAPQGGAPRFVDELLVHLKYTRYNCPYILLVMLVNPIDGEPGGGGRPLNGGFNTGGGVVIFSSYGLDHAPNMQSTLQHELGHAFGLPHVNVYGYDMAADPSLMSYNPAHHTSGFTASKTPGVFIPEDLRGLALNQRAFPGLQFDPKRDIPKGYRMTPQIVGLGPMDLPDGMANVAVSSDSGGEPSALLTGPMSPDMAWRPGSCPSGFASVEFALPLETPLTKLRIVGGSGLRSVRVLAGDVLVADTALRDGDTTVALNAKRARTWRLRFEPAPGGAAAVRGIEFYTAAGQVFPPLVPFR